MLEPCKREKEFDVIIDGKRTSLDYTSDFSVSDDFNIIKKDGYRVNIIGYKAAGQVDESDIAIKLQDFDRRFSMDVNGLVYRIEFYKNDEFCSMSKVHFRQDNEK